ncbi:MAG: hypothetical protein Q7J34_08725 [Bacteroidales bacterium]|nr:hypothetical protein [Bacteroidales bacterium]
MSNAFRPITYCLVLIGLLAASLQAHSQFYLTGEDPSSIRWMQVKSTNFKVIVPREDTITAIRFSRYLSKYYRPLHQSIKSTGNDWQILMHTRTMRSNGLVSWAPARMELMTRVPEDIYNQPWLEQLAIHEGRHMVQLDRMRIGMTGILYYIFGEQITGGIAGAFLPSWFLEGDAVYAETVFSNSGRGRSLRFLEAVSMINQTKQVSYDKMMFGSYKDYTPDAYSFGYSMTSWSRSRYGRDLWDGVLHYVARNPWNPIAFSTGIKKQTGLSKYGLYDDFIKSGILVKPANLPYTPGLTLSPKTSVFTNYSHAFPASGSEYVALRSAWNDVDRLVRKTSNGEEIIYTPASYLSESLRIRDSFAIWLEAVPHWRWTHAGKTRARMLNLKTRQSQIVSNSGDFSAVCLSDDASHLILVEQNSRGGSRLLKVMLNSHELPNEILCLENSVILSPVFLNIDTIAAVILSDSGKKIVYIPLDGSKVQTRFFMFGLDIFHLTAQKDSLFFVSESENQSFILALYPEDDVPRIIRTAASGLSWPVMNGKGSIMVSEFSKSGNAVFLLNNLSESEILMNSPPISHLADKGAAEENTKVDFLQDDTLTSVSSYKKLAHIFGIHSWGPVNTYASDDNIKPGFSVLSQNLLGTTIIQAGYEYSRGNIPWRLYSDISYTGWYPTFSLLMEYYYREAMATRQNQQVLLKLNETHVDGEIALPVNLSRGRWLRTFSPRIKAGMTFIDQLNPEVGKLKYDRYMSVEYRLFFAQSIRSARQDIMPRFGQVLDIRMRSTPLKASSFGDQYIAEMYQYLPGLYKHHGLRLYGAYEWFSQKADTRYFGRVVEEPRGQGLLPDGEAIAAGVNYTFPIGYPDMSIPWTMYLKRIRASLFADFIWVKQIPHHSVGVECLGDMHIFGFAAPVEAGFRSSYIPESNTFAWDVLFNIRFDRL